MTATAPTVGTITKADLAAVLTTAATAKAGEVELRPDCTLRFLGANGDAAVHLPFPGEIWDGEARWVDRAKLARVVKACSTDIAVESIDRALRLRFGTTTVELPEQRRPLTYLDVNDDAERRELFTMGAAELGRLLAKAAPFATQDQTRPVINAVAFDLAGGKVVATDGYRLAILDAPAAQVDDTEPLVVALGGVKLVATALSRAAGSVTVCRVDRGIVLLFDGQVWALRDVVGRYPDWRKLVPDSNDPDDDVEARFEVDAMEVVKAASLIDDVHDHRHQPMALEIASRSVVGVTVRRGPRVDVEFNAKVSASPSGGMTLGVDPEFLRSIARPLVPHAMTVEAISPLRPIVLSAAGDRFLLMPIRLTV